MTKYPKALPSKGWIRVFNPHANDWNGEAEYEYKQYTILERKKNCVVLGRRSGKSQYPWEQVFATKEECEEYWNALRGNENDRANN